MYSIPRMNDISSSGNQWLMYNSARTHGYLYARRRKQQPDLSEGAAVPVGRVDGGEDEVGGALHHVHGDLHNHERYKIFFISVVFSFCSPRES